ncbi:hypothetical protein ILUMI_04875 [Ignelater luminosus]|uniref:Uncharacterized protein n=1 Tax=Ignelater luminosus TaxID=2038154 RepID=A0A8K0DDZ0_IGNLU|nr:hypothetical protein ILUMI_04875 [Ignelater luminosus]
MEDSKSAKVPAEPNSFLQKQENNPAGEVPYRRAVVAQLRSYKTDLRPAAKRNLDTKQGNTEKINEMGKKNIEANFAREEDRRGIQKDDEQIDSRDV